MKERGYKLMGIQSYCSICPNQYWQQMQESQDNRYQKEQRK